MENVDRDIEGIEGETEETVNVGKEASEPDSDAGDTDKMN